jgi:hypothetical protein
MPGRTSARRTEGCGLQRQGGGEGHQELVPELDLVLLAAPCAALRVQYSSLQRRPPRQARAVHGLRHPAAIAARLRIQEAAIGFRSAART